jgi:hypothetical protein
MIKASATTFAAPAFAQNRTQAHPNPPVQRRKREAVAVLKVFKPTDQCLVHVGDDVLQAVAVRPLSLRAYRGSKFLQALLPLPKMFGVEVIAQKIETLVFDVGWAAGSGAKRMALGIRH